MTEKSVSLGAIAFSLPLAWAVHRNTGNTAEAGLWALVALWIAWRLWKDWPPALPRPGLALRIAALGAWALCVWVVSGLWPQDHGIIKLALPALASVLLITLWGPRLALHGGRVLLIALFWVVDPFSFLIDRLLPGPALESLTAAVASFGLWHAGIEVSRTGAQITTDVGAVVVKYGCTAIPLWTLLFHLLIPAAIALGLAWKRVVLLAFVSLVSGFLISIVRVMIIARAVNDEARFHYWHGDEGAGWFTLVAFVIFGIILVRQAPAAPAVSRPRPIAPFSRVLLGTGVAISALGLGRMLVNGVPAFATELTPPAKMGPWTLVGSETLPLPSPHVPAERPAWIKRFTYVEENTFASLTVTAAPVPVWLDGDPLVLAAHWKLVPAPAHRGPWTPVSSDNGEARLLNRGTGWLAAIHQQGAILCESSSWIPLSKQLPATAAGWSAWFRGRAPLRQKTGLWMAAETGRGGALPTEQASAVFTRWRDRYLNSDSND